MKTISVRQPYAEAIISGAKVHEYRSRKTNIRGRVAIHASLHDNGEHPDLPRGVVIGTVEIVDCMPDGHGGFAWVLRNPRRLATPFPWRGSAGWFNTPDEMFSTAS
jgi:hypothetical protein